ncbi:MAG: hypothetical protein QF615_12000, partial [Planctomycetota bacterium]|nr:hypothetical protein [Planctomycetota bacterium]
PTLARLAGASPDAHESLGKDGRDLLDAAGEAAPLFFETRKGWWNGKEFQPIHGVVSGDHILHFAPQGQAWETQSQGTQSQGPQAQGSPPHTTNRGQARLFQRLTDPLEKNDLAAENPQLVQELRALIEARLKADQARAAARGPQPTAGAGAGTMKLLRAVGYAGDEDGESEAGDR